MKKTKRWFALLIILTLLLTMLDNTTTKAAMTAWKINGNYRCVLNKVYDVDFDTHGIIYGYYKGKVALMDAVTGKLIKVTEFTDFNEIRQNPYNSNIDAIVTKKVHGTRYFGLIDQSGNTLVPPNKYTEIYYTNHGFRAIDAKKQTYYISRTGKVLYTYGDNDKLDEYGKYFLVYQLIDAENRVDIKGIYDYDGNEVTDIPEEDKTALNQYWLLYNTKIKDMKNEVIADIKKSDSKAKDIDPSVDSYGNCYLLNAHNLYYLYDRNGNLLDKSNDYLRVYGGDYIVLRNRKDVTGGIYANETVASSTLYNTKTYQKWENTDFVDVEENPMIIKPFGKYFISYDRPDYECTYNVRLYNPSGKLIKECGNNIMELGNGYALDKIYNQDMENLTFDGKFIPSNDDIYSYNIDQGEILYKTLSKNKVQLSFLDKSLNVVTKATLNKNIDNIDVCEYKIFDNNSGVYIKYCLNKVYTETVYDRNGKIIFTKSDRRGDTNFYIRSKGTTNYVGCTRLPNRLTLGRAIITSVKNTGHGEATVAWNPIPGATGYQVNVSSDGKGTDPGYEYQNHYSTKTNSLTFRALKIGGTYTFTVRAYIQHGKLYDCGRFSTSKSVKIK
ncbi:fibronectin type III domain-containing protein [Anaeromicropila herbilytica]|uniref:Fibronectin type-III domain-containing protein n=1 Tax=Anaeromicropila herbilytica TaxID=2785025 RepID=A0A7R7EM12_9FIRM|nr:fibronectin type III domain-containing protein [Anaeromicropila herbilytica]BCN30977.1 hypothetical protein bsdtb5_22720 [Anaeromicropila herbilytica]